MSSKRQSKIKPTVEMERGGKDEMNLAEFPLHFMTNKTEDQEAKTLVFHDKHGKLIVTGSDLLGLPTPIDVDVLIALIEMAKKRNDFREETVNFTRYELIRLLGWANVGSSYSRLEESLNRWAGILLIYDGNFWDNRYKKYRKETMHIIESVSIQEGRATTLKEGKQETLPLSSFTWSKQFIQSCRDNNLKNLDTAYYFSLRFPSSKQLFRFLDKRFYRQSELVFSLREIGFERVGLSRKYNDSKLKEKLADAIAELETLTVCPDDPKSRATFLKPLKREERFFKTSEGWQIRFVDGRTLPTALPLAEPEAAVNLNGLASELSARGVTQKVAAELVASYPEEYIQTKLEAFDFEMKRPKPPKRPAGYLVKSIRDGYAADPKFVSNADQQRQSEAKRQAQLKELEELSRKRQAEAAVKAEEQAADAYWQKLTADQQKQLEADALAAGGDEARQSLELMKQFRGGAGFLERVRRDYIRSLLRVMEPAEPA